MIRKQLYITETQDQVLKRRAREQGLSEAELVRQALNAHFRAGPTADPPRTAPESARQAALRELLENARHIAEHHRLPEGYRFDRAELYAEREARWGTTPPQEPTS